MSISCVQRYYPFTIPPTTTLDLAEPRGEFIDNGNPKPLYAIPLFWGQIVIKTLVIAISIILSCGLVFVSSHFRVHTRLLLEGKTPAFLFSSLPSQPSSNIASGANITASIPLTPAESDQLMHPRSVRDNLRIQVDHITLYARLAPHVKNRIATILAKVGTVNNSNQLQGLATLITEICTEVKTDLSPHLDKYYRGLHAACYFRYATIVYLVRKQLLGETEACSLRQKLKETLTQLQSLMPPLPFPEIEVINDINTLINTIDNCLSQVRPPVFVGSETVDPTKKETVRMTIETVRKLIASVCQCSVTGSIKIPNLEEVEQFLAIIETYCKDDEIDPKSFCVVAFVMQNWAERTKNDLATCFWKTQLKPYWDKELEPLCRNSLVVNDKNRKELNDTLELLNFFIKFAKEIQSYASTTLDELKSLIQKAETFILNICIARDATLRWNALSTSASFETQIESLEEDLRSQLADIQKASYLPPEDTATLTTILTQINSNLKKPTTTQEEKKQLICNAVQVLRRSYRSLLEKEKKFGNGFLTQPTANQELH